MLGLKRGTVTLYPYQEEWKAAGQAAAELLWALLGSAAVDIQHVGPGRGEAVAGGASFLAKKRPGAADMRRRAILMQVSL